MTPSGDQPKAIKQLTNGIREGINSQTLLGVTGSGKTFTIANVIEKVQFSSKRKWGGLNIKEYGSWLMGAPEIILGTKYDSYKDIIEKK